MADFKLPYLADGVTEFRGPVDLTKSPIVSLGTVTSDSVTATARLFDVARDTEIVDLATKLSADEPATETEIAVDDITGFADGDSVEVLLDSGLIHATTISGAPAAGVITLAVGLDTAASENNRLTRVTLNTNATYLSVKSVKNWEVGNKLVLIHDSLARQDSLVAQVLAEPCPLLVIADAVAAVTSARMEVKAQLGDDLTMADFGTEPSPPVAGSSEWGYRATIPHDHTSEIRPGMYVRSEMTVFDDPINAFQVAFATVQRAS